MVLFGIGDCDSIELMYMYIYGILRTQLYGSKQPWILALKQVELKKLYLL